MRFLLDNFFLGILNLKRHLLRSTLTSLGIILGVSAVIVMVSIGEGRKQQAIEEIQALGATNIILRSVRPPESKNTGSQSRSRVARYGITHKDHRRVSRWSKEATSIVPLKRVGSEVSYESSRKPSQSFGTTPDLLNVAGLELEEGRYLNDIDMVNRKSVAVLGHHIANQLFPLKSPIGENIRIDTRIFKIIGILKPVGLAGGKGSALVGRDLNQDIHLPLTTANLEFGNIVVQRLSGAFSAEETELTELYIVAPDVNSVPHMSAMLREIIKLDHLYKGDVQIIVPNELLENVRKTTFAMNILLISIAAISLIVGGIGIMNIMLASVVERTREIGIRRALGASRFDIISQFVVETGSISSVGGSLGVVLGLLISISLEFVVPHFLNLLSIELLVGSDLNFKTVITLWSVLVSFFVATITGLIFGIYPAFLASKQDPIEALRHD